MTTFDIVIPAGGEIDEDFATQAGTKIRALAPIGPNRRPVLQVVVDALRKSGRAGKIIVIGPDALQPRIEGVDLWIAEPTPTGGIAGGPANILAGLRALPLDRLALVCTSDLPFLTPKAVANFVDGIEPSASISAGLVSADAFTERFPDAPPSDFVRLADAGQSTIACLFAVRPDAILGKMHLVMSAFTARKSQWGMIRLLGPRLVWEFATRRLSVLSIRERLERLLDCRIGIIDDAAPEAAFDIDTLDDYLYSDSKAV